MKPGMGWPIGIVAILVTTMTANIVMMRVAGNDPSFAVEPDYYRKAVNHDSTMAQARMNSALGWSATAAIAFDGAGTPILSVRLVDSAGSLVEDAHLSAVAMFVGRANETDSVALAPGADGSYTARLSRAYAGQWEVRVEARKEADRFTATVRTESPAIPVFPHSGLQQ